MALLLRMWRERISLTNKAISRNQALSVVLGLASRRRLTCAEAPTPGPLLLHAGRAVSVELQWQVCPFFQ
jgi:hypothetical protein